MAGQNTAGDTKARQVSSSDGEVKDEKGDILSVTMLTQMLSSDRWQPW